MTALRKTLFVEAEPVAAVAVARAPKLYVVPTTAPAEAAPAGGTVKNIALFLAAPFLGLFYIVALPIVGIGVLAVLAVRAAAKLPMVRTLGLALKHIGMLVAAPFIGLAYVVFFPVVCLALLAWTGGRALAGTNMR
jgi:hypothetical protein